ncbi:MAG: hypothetical protein N3G80_00610 [Candidatus Micrarchaeota archaeon]|nr:hypothetical protein [Candidatus Micrarchaeota archaeon]
MARKEPSESIRLIVEELSKQEKEQDKILASVRQIVRHCANAIRLLHALDAKKAKAEIKKAEEMVKKFSHTKKFEYLLLQPYQEIAEAKLLLAAVENNPLPGWRELDMPFEPYLLGLCDLVGELRRQMLEMLKAGNLPEAERYFSLMSEIHEQLQTVRFSNSLLPNFKKKQDVVRLQTEQARSELVMAKMQLRKRSSPD